MSLLLAPENLPFTVALAVMLGIAVMEGALTMVGAGLSGFLDNLLPEIDVDGPEIGDPTGPTTAMSQFMGWLTLGKVPALVLLVAFLTCFGLLGIIGQSMANAIIGTPLPSPLAAAGAFVVALPFTRWTGRIVSKVIPADETSAVSRDEFIGLIATITLGKAKRGSAAEAKLRDRHGLTHYIFVEPDVKGDRFNQGDEVLLVRKAGKNFRAIANPNVALSGDPGSEGA